ncbi:hypothetical protein D3C85_1701320 [compost metagenome]
MYLLIQRIRPFVQGRARQVWQAILAEHPLDLHQRKSRRFSQGNQRELSQRFLAVLTAQAASGTRFDQPELFVIAQR